MPLPPLLFHTLSYASFARKMLAEAGSRLEAGSLHIKSFPDGETYHRLISQVRGREVWLLGGTITDQDTLELYDLAQGCVQYGAAALTLIVPYFGYSTMERSVNDGEIVKAKSRALLLSSVPAAPLGSRIVLVDLHAEGIPFYFAPDLQPFHIHTLPLIEKMALALAGNCNFVLAATDAGRAKWIESMANHMGVPAAFIYKRRLDGTHTEVTATNADVAGQHVIIYDDMIRTGGSLLQAAKAYSAEGAAKISVITTHGLFNEQAIEKIAASKLVQAICSQDTHPAVLSIQHPLLKVVSAAAFITNKLLENGN